MTGLGMASTRVTDAGLAHLKGWKNLAYIDLQGTRVTDADPDGHGRARCYARRGRRRTDSALSLAQRSSVGDRHQAQLAPADEPQLGLDVALEGVQ